MNSLQDLRTQYRAFMKMHPLFQRMMQFILMAGVAYFSLRAHNFFEQAFRLSVATSRLGLIETGMTFIASYISLLSTIGAAALVLNDVADLVSSAITGIVQGSKYAQQASIKTCRSILKLPKTLGRILSYLYPKLELRVNDHKPSLEGLSPKIVEEFAPIIDPIEIAGLSETAPQEAHNERSILPFMRAIEQKNETAEHSQQSSAGKITPQCQPAEKDICFKFSITPQGVLFARHAATAGYHKSALNFTEYKSALPRWRFKGM